jgi:hypothetical protein
MCSDMSSIVTPVVEPFGTKWAGDVLVRLVHLNMPQQTVAMTKHLVATHLGALEVVLLNSFQFLALLCQSIEEGKQSWHLHHSPV